MEKICKNCDHWEPGVKAAPKPDMYGECNELSHHELNPDYILPVIDKKESFDPNSKMYEYITGANFGCNHFAEA